MKRAKDFFIFPDESYFNTNPQRLNFRGPRTREKIGLVGGFQFPTPFTSCHELSPSAVLFSPRTLPFAFSYHLSSTWNFNVFKHTMPPTSCFSLSTNRNLSLFRTSEFVFPYHLPSGKSF